ncbi:protein DYAD-like [Diospyros lotus]|uniref:protein DYAD-like n=1 Tax=Diospyros lotus TaxID=55363 RepID=UPI0022551C6A|nr:protein DYAD-like [Diospyros lotus]
MATSQLLGYLNHAHKQLLRQIATLRNSIIAWRRQMMYLKKQEGGGTDDDGAPPPSPLARHELSESDCPNAVGSAYQIDQTKLPSRTPAQLMSIRTVMVREKSELNVSVRFPSINSLQTYFSGRTGELPDLDEMFVMGTKLAEKVLDRKVPSQEFDEKKQSVDFWLATSNSVSGFSNFILKNSGVCLSELKCEGMVRWGARRQVKFIGRHRENNTQSSSSIVRGGDKTRGGGNEEEGEEEGAEIEEEDDDDEEEAVTEETNQNKQTGNKQTRKRKCYSSKIDSAAKKAKRERQTQTNKTKAKNKSNQSVVLKNPQDRWSAERYKLAEKNLLEVMKAKGAVFGNPILRPELRAEARKRIGDTGLLDHLLKHMAGKVAPGGAERFRRRHNAEGAMEYWLEGADLVDIRREAGVQDPYWTPPPGWKPGDCPTQDPICAKELKQLKEVIAKLERNMEQMVPKKLMEEELAILRREMEELLSEKHTIMGSYSSGSSQKLDPDTSLAPLMRSDIDGSLITLEKYKGQIVSISENLTGFEEEIGKLKSKVTEETSCGSALLLASTKGCADEKEKKKAQEKGEALGAQQQEEARDDLRKRNPTEKMAAAAGARAEGKAAKIQRLKSGFRICKPQGTFLWPNMVTTTTTGNISSPLFAVPTPPSVSSSTANHHHHLPASPVKPLAEKLPFAATAAATGDENLSTSPAGSKTPTCLINLNDLPGTNHGDIFCRTVMPTLVSSSNRMSYNELLQQQGGYNWCSSASSGSYLQKGSVGSSSSWLALATPSSTPTPTTLDDDDGSARGKSGFQLNCKGMLS